MLRFLAGAAACFLLMTGAFLIWQSRAAQGPGLPDAPAPRLASALPFTGKAQALRAPEASAKNREERRLAARTRTRTVGSRRRRSLPRGARRSPS